MINKKNISIADICRFIWQIEEKYLLFNQTIDNIYFWELIRFRLLRTIYDATQRIELNQHNNTASKKTRSIKKRLVEFINFSKSVYNSYLYGVYNNKQTVDILIFEHPRKVFYQNSYIDIYTDDFVNRCKKKNIHYELIEAPYNGAHFNKASLRKSYLEHDYFSLIIRRLIDKYSPNKRVSLLDCHIKLLRQIQNEIANRFHVKIDLFTPTINQLSTFKLEYDFYNHLLLRKKPKKVYCVISYGQKPLISACKDNNIETVEFQHGFMSKYHLGYSYPGKQKIHYFPDKIFLFGKYWSSSTPLPLSEHQIIYDGFPYIERKLRKVTVSKRKNQILFISQQPMGKDLFKISCKFARKHPDYIVIFKPHPTEIAYAKIDQYSRKIKGLKNFILIQSNSTDIYNLLASSEYVVGIFSTALFEAIAIKCKVLLVNLPGIENMENFLEKKYAILVNNEDDIYESINHYSLDHIDPKQFFSNL